MTPRARNALVVVVVIALASFNLVLPMQEMEHLEPTTYGTTVWGYRIVFDLLTELGVPVTRFHENPERLPPGGTAWWIAPARVCLDADTAPEVRMRPPGWIAAGGTAVFFLPSRAHQVCAIGDLPVPSRKEVKNWHVDGLGPSRTVSRHTALLAFDGTDPAWVTRATLGEKPFVLERLVGNGRVVLVADAALLQNVAFKHDDLGPLLLDVVRAFGAPTIVEAETATATTRSGLGYLAGSPAAPLLAGLIVLGALVAWRGTLIPARVIDGPPLAAPTLQTFVESIAALYATSRDYGRVRFRYRELTLRRLRRHLGLQPNAPVETVVDRIERLRPHARAAREVLTARDHVGGAEDLRAAVGRLDALVVEVSR